MPRSKREIMLAHPEHLRASHLPPPEPPRRRRVSREMRGLLTTCGTAFGGIILFAQSDETLWSVLFVLSLVTWLIASVVTLALPPVRLISGDYRRARRERELANLFRAHHGRYRLPHEFLPGAPRDLMTRAQAAVDLIENSAVERDHLLDSTANAVILPHHLWEIAVTLSEVSCILRQLAEATDGMDDALRTRITASHRSNLDTATTAVLRRVEALEHYATLVRSADAAYRAHLNTPHLAALDHRSRDLLAETARHDTSLPHLTHLSTPTPLLDQALRSTLTAALEAAHSLHP
ncbi:hypothetical protein GCM10010468_10830 [Actinocorallia longicatena]|uniref:Uncharacterized protein n=1 Tax=Actinocorallia longicatena TaxID=111803 RepID=A0ABP6Q0S6_9ACTN